jgi:DNA-binding IclR family transcriptional regulator
VLRQGWLRELPAEATAVYAFLCLAANRDGVSFYRRSRIGEELGLDDQQVHRALARLEELDLVGYEPFRPGAVDGFRQVLALPSTGPTRAVDSLLQGMAERLARRDDADRQRSV